MEESFVIIVLFWVIFIIISALLIWLVKTGKVEFEDTNAIKNTIRLFRTNPPYYRGIPKKRLHLLEINSSYLKDYDDLWKEQILIKPNLEAELKIKVIYIRDNSRVFKFKINDFNAIDNLWDIILSNFAISNYDTMLKIIKESTVWEWSGVKYDEKSINKIDINNCSESELSDLPGISIITAKKIIRYRKEILGFKSIEDFFEFLGLKQHFREILTERIDIKKMKLPKTIKLTKERKIDL